jgi:hypothetical protein
MVDSKDAPIQEQQFLSGVTVVDIGDVRVARGLSRRHFSACPHRKLIYDGQERRIWCKDCENDVEPFDAFKSLVEHHHAALKKIEAREARLVEAERFQIRALATKAIDAVWRRRKVVPICPHCKSGLFPEDFSKSIATMGREFAARRAGRAVE